MLFPAAIINTIRLGLICLLVLSSCNSNSNIKGINVQGCVTDSAGLKPIPEARVTILCWYHAEWDKTDYISIDTITDPKGCFNVKFDKGYKVVVAGISTGYFPNFQETEDLSKTSVQLNIKLSQRKDSAENDDNINLSYYIIRNTTD